jgi:hypothetical protein
LFIKISFFSLLHHLYFLVNPDISTNLYTYIFVYFSKDYYIIFESDTSSKTKIPNTPKFQELFYSKREERKFKLEKLRED